MIGMTLGMSAFFAVYFWLLRHPQRAVTIMPVTPVDRLIGFRPEALFPYVSLWFYVTVVPALLIDRRELVTYALSALALGGICLGIFFFWPTAVPPLEVDWSSYSAFAFLKSVDASGNACPSLHVAFAVFTASWLGRILRQMGVGRFVRVLNWLWCAGILYSTIATRQHVVLDVIAGTMLGGVVALVNGRLLLRHRAGW